jgi:hypothetical protein
MRIPGVGLTAAFINDALEFTGMSFSITCYIARSENITFTQGLDDLKSPLNRHVMVGLRG